MKSRLMYLFCHLERQRKIFFDLKRFFTLFRMTELILLIALPNCALSQEPKVIPFENFNSYSTTADVFKNWASRKDPKFNLIKKNNMYFLEHEKENKFLCGRIESRNNTLPSTAIYKELKNKTDIRKALKKNERVILSWSWKALKLPEGSDERFKLTNDNALGVYAIFYVGWFRVRYLKFVWSTTDNIGVVSKSYTEETGKTIILNNKNSQLNQWLDVSVDLTDYAKKHLDDYSDIELVAVSILTDADNLGKEVFGCYDNFVINVKQ